MIRVGTRGIQSRVPRQARGLTLCIAFGIALVGCKPAQENTELVCDREAYISQSGEYRPDAGEGILSANSADPISVGYFDKPFNQDWLRAIGRASIHDTIRFIETTGARVYRADPISEKSARNLESAREMPADISAKWKVADRPVSGSTCGFLAGLYLPVQSQSLPSLKNKAAIVVRTDAGRWTLVHEFMHHNYKTQAALRGYDDEVTQARRVDLYNRIDGLKKNKSIGDRDYAKRLTELFLELIEVVDRHVVQYRIEEMAVEATLQDAYETGELSYVSSASFANADFYISYSKKEVEEMYKALTATYDELFRLTVTNGLFAERAKLDRFIPMRDLRIAQMESLVAKRKAHGYVQPEPRGDALMASSVFSPHSAVPAISPCSDAESLGLETRRIVEVSRAKRLTGLTSR